MKLYGPDYNNLIWISETKVTNTMTSLLGNFLVYFMTFWNIWRYKKINIGRFLLRITIHMNVRYCYTLPYVFLLFVYFTLPKAKIIFLQTRLIQRFTYQMTNKIKFTYFIIFARNNGVNTILLNFKSKEILLV